MSKESKKWSIVATYIILEKYSNPERPLYQKKINEYMQEMFGKKVDRKTIGDSINVLINDCKVNIGTKNGKGFYIAKRTFTDDEIRYLIDAVLSSNMIDADMSKTLVKKLIYINGPGTSLDNLKVEKGNSTLLSDRRPVFDNIRIICQAINKKCRIEYSLLSYDINGNLKQSGDKKYIRTPHFLIADQGNYSLACSKGDEEYLYFQRLDMMGDIRLVKTIKSNSKTELKSFDAMTDESYKKNISVKALLLDEDFLSTIYEIFKNDAKAIREKGRLIVTMRGDRTMLTKFILANISSMTILGPAPFKKEILNTLKFAINRHIINA